MPQRLLDAFTMIMESSRENQVSRKIIRFKPSNKSNLSLHAIQSRYSMVGNRSPATAMSSTATHSANAHANATSVREGCAVAAEVIGSTKTVVISRQSSYGVHARRNNCADRKRNALDESTEPMLVLKCDTPLQRLDLTHIAPGCQPRSKLVAQPCTLGNGNLPYGNTGL
jgi:hypothetical protein